MTGMGKILVVIALCTAGTTLWGARIELTGAENKATLKTKLLPQRSSSVASVDLELRLPAIEINRDRAGFDALSVQGLVPSSIIGNPEVYLTGSLLVVPPGYEPQLESVQVQTKELAGVQIRPAQQEWRCGGPKGSFAFNSQLYSSDSVYPNQWAQLEEVGALGGARLVRVAMNPVRANLGAKSIEVAYQMNVRVSFKQTQRSPANIELPETLWKTLIASTVNGKSLSHAVRRSERAERMVILVADGFQEAIRPYVSWKQSRGLEVDVVTLTQAGSSKEAMQKHIQTAYDQASVKPTYLVFVGNKDTMPAFKESTGSGSAASDYRMTLLAGDDAIPDVFYGRFLADTEDELRTQIQRTIEYERNPGSEPWYRKAMTIASDEGSNPSDEGYALQVQEALAEGSFDSFDSFFQGDKTATSSNILEALQEGRSWIAYFGHGSGTSWGSVNDRFNNSTIEKVENNGRLPVLIDVACLNASWINLPKCFGKTWMTQTNAQGPVGTVAYYGGSVSISWHPPAIMSVGIAKRHVESSLPTIGSSVIAGQLYLMEQMGNTTAVKDNLKWYNLFGDPSLVVRAQ